jgi:hypothetical protein
MHDMYVEQLKGFLRKNVSFFALVFFSIAFLSSSILARKILTDSDFYYFTSVLTIISIYFSLCFLGSEQLLLRHASVMSFSRIRINGNILLVMFFSLILFSLVFSVISELMFFRLQSKSLYILIGLCVGSFVFVYNSLRLQGFFFLAQVAANGWKLPLLLAVASSLWGDFRFLISSSLFISFLFTIIIFQSKKKYIDIFWSDLPEDWFNLYLGFMGSLFTIMLIGHLDRLLVVKYLSPSEFSNYVYLIMILIMPFSLIANYFGFREVPKLKVSYNPRSFLSRIKLIGFGCIVLFSLWFIFVWAISSYLQVNIESDFFIPSVLIIVARILYSFMSALFGLTASARDIMISNVIFIILIVASTSFLVFIGFTVLNILYFSAFIWSSRFSLYFLFSRKIKAYG